MCFHKTECIESTKMPLCVFFSVFLFKRIWDLESVCLLSKLVSMMTFFFLFQSCFCLHFNSMPMMLNCLFQAKKCDDVEIRFQYAKPFFLRFNFTESQIVDSEVYFYRALVQTQWNIINFSNLMIFLVRQDSRRILR